MRQTYILLVLALAALLEAAGDALVRQGLRAAGLQKVTFFAAGAVVLFLYGCTVNRPAWDFGRLLGLYVVFFFLLAQAISWLIFHQRPTGGVLLGGGFIAAGGLIIWMSQR